MNYQELSNADVSRGLSSDNVLDQFKHNTLQERRLKCENDSIEFQVAIINVTGELNVGNIIRTASLTGAQKVHVLGRRKFDTRGTVGANNYIDVRRVDLMIDDLNIDVHAVQDYFYNKRLHPIYVEQSPNSMLLSARALNLLINHGYEQDLTPCFVFGNEGRGIPRELIGNATTLRLAQRGVIRSYNVGSTAAIVLYAAMMHME